MVPPAETSQRLPRLVATDLDGTLVRSDGTVSAYTAQVLADLDDRGVHVVFVTGRPLRWARDVFSYVGSHGLAIVSNGALVWDVAADLPWLERPMSPAVTLDVARSLRAAIPGVRFAVETVAGWAMEPDYLRHRADDDRGFSPRREVALEELADGPVLKLLARGGGLAADEFVAAAVAVVGDRVNVTHSSFPLLEISALEVTKASTLALIAEKLGVEAADVIAFGDMPNDLPMLTWAGTSYAMADAHPTVLECATHVAPGHDDDGVAQVLAGVLDR
ncbi:Cof-type HAD-IIB family hydrolase [Nocardioides sp. CER19]|uniref:Cof-type HAD-IIB family hydrolase n=1 Tax=Nocardioides sp. CER19 TaxID=3038538 RepID=UPI00244CC2B6|nr:Cof-type HAD-IIB family hydrolase [Nocardioides sp. CER19]MDH2412959.1 Cof-type HAD-IIB family hydrolase [Nocardioides sp. CER19]